MLFFILTPMELYIWLFVWLICTFLLLLYGWWFFFLYVIHRMSFRFQLKCIKFVSYSYRILITYIYWYVWISYNVRQNLFFFFLILRWLRRLFLHQWLKWCIWKWVEKWKRVFEEVISDIRRTAKRDDCCAEVAIQYWTHNPWLISLNVTL